MGVSQICREKGTGQSWACASGSGPLVKGTPVACLQRGGSDASTPAHLLPGHLPDPAHRPAPRWSRWACTSGSRRTCAAAGTYWTASSSSCQSLTLWCPWPRLGEPRSWGSSGSCGSCAPYDPCGKDPAPADGDPCTVRGISQGLSGLTLPLCTHAVLCSMCRAPSEPRAAGPTPGGGACSRCWKAGAEGGPQGYYPLSVCPWGAHCHLWASSI